MSTQLKIAVVLLAVIFAVLAVFLLIGNHFGDDGTDKNNNNLKQRNSQSN